MRKLLIVVIMAASLCGCANLPLAYIPTGNPVTDVLVTAMVQEVGGAIASEIIGGGISRSISRLLSPKEDCRRIHNMVFCGDWD